MTHARPRGAQPATLLFGLALGLSAASPAAAALPKVPEGFEIKLVAAVPAVQYPCQVATAPDGSLFVGEDPMDQVGPADKPIDRILLFRAGKEPVVFAEKLNAIFGMVWRSGALYVMNMPNLTVLRDTDGDGKADLRTELFTNLGVPAGQPNMFNDHIVSGIQIGIDNYLYISVGDKGVPRATGKDGRTAQVIGGGVLRCRLDGTGLEVFSTGTRNHLEPNLDARDNLFTYDNTDDGLGWWTRVTHHIDGGAYGYPWDYHDRTDRMLNRMAEYGGGSPCGGFVYREDVWPEKYRGRGFWAEWGKRTVRAIAFAPAGASFRVADDMDFVAPGDVSDFRPLDLALSYDGRTMYIADWSLGSWNNKTEKLGRVYAVTYKGQVETRPRGLDTDSIAAQIVQLDHPSFNERSRAQTALSKTGRPALGAATAALADPKINPVAKRHLVWVIDAIAGGAPDATLPLLNALKSPGADVRAQAARALGERGVPSAWESLVALLSDREPSARLQAIIALGRIAQPKSVPALIPIVGDGDPYLAFSARTALRRIAKWKAVAAGLDATDAKTRAGVLLTLEMAYDPDAVSALAAFAADPKRDPDERAKALGFLAQGHHKPIAWNGKWWGTQPANSKRFAKTVDWPGTGLVLASIRQRLSDASTPVRLAAVAAVIESHDEGALRVLRDRFRTEAEPAVRSAVARALGTMKDKSALPLLIAAMRDARTPETVRDAALEGVEAIGSDVALGALLKLLESGSLAVEKQSKVVAALGRFRSAEAATAVVHALTHPSPLVRAAAAEAVGKLGKAPTAVKPLLALLADPSLGVRKAAISALGDLKVGDAVPALIDAAGTADTRFEASRALAAIGDVRAVPVYLHALADRSPELRRLSASAMVRVRDRAVPVLEQLAARKELPSTALPELRRIYTSVRPIMSWHLLGPVPIKSKPPFSIDEVVDLKSKYTGSRDKALMWQPAQADSDTGEIDLGKLFHGGDDVAAFGYAEVESPGGRRAEMAVGSDDTLTVWVNGAKVYDFQEQRGFDAAKDRVSFRLVQGKNRLVVKCGNVGGAWLFSVAVTSPSDYAFLKGPAPGAFDPETFRKFAQSAKGQPNRGRALFSDLKGLACIKCHTVGGQGGTVGPELSSVGAKYPRDELIASVLYPSAKISSGYEPVVVAVDDGRVITGIIKGETPEALELEDGEARRQQIDKKSIEDRKRSDVSLMPNGLAEGLQRQDFADLISFLETLKDAGPIKPAAGGGR